MFQAGECLHDWSHHDLTLIGVEDNSSGFRRRTSHDLCVVNLILVSAHNVVELNPSVVILHLDQPICQAKAISAF